MGETNIFKVLADSQRRDILIMLRNERLNAGEIAEKLQITPAALSYHLKLLKNADLISEYKEKNFVYYEINTTVFDELIIWVNLKWSTVYSSVQRVPSYNYGVENNSIHR